MKKLLVTLLVFSLGLTGSMLQVLAVPAPSARSFYGDVNQSGSVNITDATIIQKTLASQTTLDYLQSLLADYNHDGEITIADVTDIQKSIAGVKLPPNCGGFLFDDVRVSDFYTDYISGSIIAGRAVTFTAEVRGSGSGFTYEFMINDTVVQPRSESNSFTYVFEEAGVYNVKVRAYNEWSCYYSSSMHYSVLDETYKDKVRIISTKLTTEHFYPIINCLITAQAEGGEGPYCYDFILRPESGYGETGLSEKNIEAFNQYIKNNETDWQIRYDEHNFAYFYREFSENNSVCIDRDMWGHTYPGDNFELLIQAKDSNDLLSGMEIIYLRFAEDWC